MNERAWERERVKIIQPFQVSKLQTSACSQCSGKGVPVRISARPVKLPLQESLLASAPGCGRGGHPAPRGCIPGDTTGAAARRVSCADPKTQASGSTLPHLVGSLVLMAEEDTHTKEPRC